MHGEGATAEEEIGGQKQFYNTFWLIKDKVIPSSVIIEEMISVLNSLAPEKRGVSFKINELVESKKQHTVWPDDTKTEDLTMANRYVIDYDITFNLGELLNKAAKKAGN
jgi:hypothetical protein